MNRTAQKRLVDRLTTLCDEGFQRPAISLDEFFKGNTDQASLGGGDDVPLKECEKAFRAVERRKGVRGFFLEVNEIPDLEDEPDMWTTVIRAIVVTSTSVENVLDWLAPLRFREAWDCEMMSDGDQLTEIRKKPRKSPDEGRIRLTRAIPDRGQVHVVIIDLRNVRFADD